MQSSSCSKRPRIPPERFHEFLVLAAGLDSAERGKSPYGQLFASIAAMLEATDKGKKKGSEKAGQQILNAIPALIGELFSARGWGWNGFYRLNERQDALELGHAWGPAVCTPLPLRGEALSSGMCWDALTANHGLLASSVRDWPGYVSCDGPSGLATVSGLACPLRSPGGSPLGVWDLDSSQSLEHRDARAMEAVFACLSSCLELESCDLG